jgi:diguanylate cyclase (GGDEF)-like protein
VLPFPGSSAGLWCALTQAVALATDERGACAAITHEISRALEVPAWIIEVGRDRRIVAEAGRDTPSDPDDVLREMDLSAWTAIPLSDSDRSTVLVIAGDASTLGPVLGGVTFWLPGALAAVRERNRRARADAVLADVYKLARRTGRSGELDAICQSLVDQASRTVAAERVALALFRSDEQRLALAATHGYALSDVRNVRIQPGEWVMGHVYSCKRAVLVRDVHRLRSLSDVTRRYRSSSFAVVPIVIEGQVIAVLSATDKVDGGTFTRQDIAALRTIGGVAALGMSAARSDAEARRLAHAATIDSLTGLFNRQSFDVRLRQEIERAKRSSGTLAVLMIDIDDFKSINDTHGHPAGDAVLQAVSDVLRSVVRVFDVCARYGGDEFAIVMPNSERASSSAAAERIRERISNSDERDARLAERVTVSVGIATLRAGETADEIVRRADDGLYRAKAAGKNCVRMAPSRTVKPFRPIAGRITEGPSSR